MGFPDMNTPGSKLHAYCMLTDGVCNCSCFSRSILKKSTALGLLNSVLLEVLAPS